MKTDWHMFKADSMTKEVENAKSSQSTLKKGTLQGNITRIKSAQQKIKDLQAAISKVDKHMELQKLRDELSSTPSELSKAQDVLRKTTKKLS